MDGLPYLAGLVIGLFVFASAALRLLSRIRARHRYARVPGVIVGRRDARGESGAAPGTHRRAAVFRFTALDGRVIETESNVQSFPGPKPGKHVTVVYDPQRPYGAEPAGRSVILMLLLPVLMAIGLAIAVAVLGNLL